MSTLPIMKTKKGPSSNLFEMIAMGFLVVLLVGSVIFTLSISTSSAPTGYVSLSGLSLEETKQKANFDISLLDGLPFAVTKEEGGIYITEYGSKEFHRVNLHYSNEKTGQELYVVFSKLEKDLKEYELSEREIVKLNDGKQAKYGIVEFGEGLTWIKDGISYGIYNHVHKGQPTLGVEKLKELAENL
ncbi:hypothetical protein [Pseudoneobacillus sp. C159]